MSGHYDLIWARNGCAQGGAHGAVIICSPSTSLIFLRKDAVWYIEAEHRQLCIGDPNILGIQDELCDLSVCRLMNKDSCEPTNRFESRFYGDLGY